MSIINTFLLTVSTATFVLSFFVFLKNRKKANICFGILVVIAGLWSLSIGLFREADNLFYALFMSRLIYICGILISPAILAFAHVLSKRKLKVSYVLAYIFPALILTALLFYPNLWIQEINLTPKGNHIQLGPAYLAWVILFAVYMVWGFLVLWKAYKKSRGLYKMQSRYILLSLLFPVLGSVPFNVVAPWFGYYEFIWIGPIFLTSMLVTISYAILKYRLMDIHLLIKRSAVYFVSLLTACISVLFVVEVISSFWNVKSYAIVINLAVVIGVILFSFLRSQLKKVGDKLLFRAKTSAQQTLKNVSAKLLTIIEFERLINLVVKGIQKAIGVSKIAIFLYKPDSGEYKIENIKGFEQKKTESLIKAMADHFEEDNTVLLYEEIKQSQLKKKMDSSQAKLCLPLISSNSVKGGIILGEKNSGDGYSKEDLELLETLANQTSLALDNARLYNQVQDLNQNLEQKVKEQTKDIKSLLNMKSELLDTISHQLRTPTSIFKGMLSMIEEKDSYELSQEKKKEFIQQALASADRLAMIIDSIMQANELQGKLPVLDVEPTKAEEFIKEIISSFKHSAKQREIDLKFIKPKQELPFIFVHKRYLKSALEKLIDNAIWYTREGGKVSISVKHNKPEKTVSIKVKDTGIGLTKKDKDKLFKRFSRGRGASMMNVNSSGLGLYIAKRIVKAHKGKIKAESEGKDKGSTFTITLPVMQGI